MAKSSRHSHALVLFFIVPAFLFGCGGGGSGESSLSEGSIPTKTLSWNPPVSYQDGSSLDPVAELDSFEIYIKENTNFSDTDEEMAVLSATDKETGRVCTSFNLGTLAPFLTKGVTYYVSIRAVAKTGLKSDFSAAATFTL